MGVMTWGGLRAPWLHLLTSVIAWSNLSLGARDGSGG
jgi:hypothetical protein